MTVSSSTGREFVSIDFAAQQLGVSVQTIRRRIASGELRGYRMGNRVIRVDPNDLDALLRPIPAADGGDAT